MPRASPGVSYVHVIVTKTKNHMLLSGILNSSRPRPPICLVSGSDEYHVLGLITTMFIDLPF